MTRCDQPFCAVLRFALGVSIFAMAVQVPLPSADCIVAMPLHQSVAYFLGKFQGISPQNMARNMLRLRTSINWILNFIPAGLSMDVDQKEQLPTLRIHLHLRPHQISEETEAAQGHGTSRGGQGWSFPESDGMGIFRSLKKIATWEKIWKKRWGNDGKTEKWCDFSEPKC